jgi:hypothetical protein
MPEFLNSPVDVALGAILGMVVPWLVIGPIWWWLTRHDWRRWALQRQLWQMEDQIWRESLPDWPREVIVEPLWKRIAIRREARHRLSLREEDGTA